MCSYRKWRFVVTDKGNLQLPEGEMSSYRESRCVTEESGDNVVTGRRDEQLQRVEMCSYREVTCGGTEVRFVMTERWGLQQERDKKWSYKVVTYSYRDGDLQLQSG